MEKDTNTLNQFMVGLPSISSDEIIVNRFPRHGLLTRDEALNLSAWLRVLADPTGTRADAYVKAVEES